MYSEMALGQNVKIFKKCILAWPTERWAHPDYWQDYLGWPIFFPWEMNIYRREQIAYNVRKIKNGGLCGYGGMGTIVHLAIQVAAVLGADRITLVGCEHRYDKSLHSEASYCKKNQPFIRGGEKHLGVHQNEVFGLAQLELRGTWYFAEELHRYGVNVRRYYYPEGYRRIIEEDGVEHWDVGQYDEWKRRYPVPKELEGLTLDEIREGKEKKI